MKKAKVMLVAIAILGVVGGVFASKAHSPQPFFSTDSNGDCVVAFQTLLTTAAKNAPGSFYDATIATLSGDCGVTVSVAQ